MKKRNKIIAVVLVIALCISCLGYKGNQVYASENVKVKKFVENGEEYIVTTSKNGDKTKAVIEYGEKKIELKRVNDIVTSTEYNYEGKNFFGKDKYKVVRKNNFDASDYEQIEKNVKAEYTWNSKTKTPKAWGSVYWYQYGTSSYNNAYLQIGCKAKYRIKYYKLSSKKQKECKELTEKIRKSNVKYHIAEGTVGAGTLALICGSIIASMVTIEVPIGAIITAVVTIVGGYGAAVTAAAWSYYYYLGAKDDYTIVKTYGTKL